MIYGVSSMIQKGEVTEYCFGSCGKILIGIVHHGQFGDWYPCREDNCPHEDRHSDIMGKVIGEKFCMRKLKVKEKP